MDEKAFFLQVYDAVLSAATPTTVELAAYGTNANSSKVHGRLLNSNLYPKDSSQPQNSALPSGALHATLYALNMEFSSGLLRNSADQVLIGVHFTHAVSWNVTRHIQVELDDGRFLATDATKTVHLPGNSQRQIVAATLPKGYTGQVC
jgi:hypothetical protein